jgi:hypothetical protein
MNALELKIPPPAVALVAVVAACVVSKSTPTMELAAPFRTAVALVIALLGGGISLARVIAFRRARTTVNPRKRKPPPHWSPGASIVPVMPLALSDAMNVAMLATS